MVQNRSQGYINLPPYPCSFISQPFNHSSIASSPHSSFVKMQFTIAGLIAIAGLAGQAYAASDLAIVVSSATRYCNGTTLTSAVLTNNTSVQCVNSLGAGSSAVYGSGVSLQQSTMADVTYPILHSNSGHLVQDHLFYRRQLQEQLLRRQQSCSQFQLLYWCRKLGRELLNGMQESACWRRLKER